MNFCTSSDTPEPPTFIQYLQLQLRLIPSHSLWGHVLWNASKLIVEKIQNGEIIVKDHSVLELGSGAAIPSIISYLNGAKSVTATDYPETEILENISYNCEHNNAIVQVLPLLWGNTTGQKYDIIFLCDLVFNHNEHMNLAKTILGSLSAEGIAYCTFSSHQPNKKLQDLQFFEICEHLGLKCTLVETKFMGRMFPEDDEKYKNYEVECRENVYLWEIKLID